MAAAESSGTGKTKGGALIDFGSGLLMVGIAFQDGQ